jgi:hypothetical protein
MEEAEKHRADAREALPTKNRETIYEELVDDANNGK